MEKATRFCHGKCPSTTQAGTWLCVISVAVTKKGQTGFYFFLFFSFSPPPPHDCLASTLMDGLNGPRQTERSEEVDMQHTEN